MKLLILLFLYVGIVFSGCGNKPPNTKLFIKSVKTSKGLRIDWYVYSSITSLAPDYLQISDDDKEPFFKCFCLSDIQFENDSLFISLYRNEYDLDKSKLGEISIFIDTTGKHWNQASSRIGRLRKRDVNIEKPHFIDTYCEKGECE